MIFIDVRSCASGCAVIAALVMTQSACGSTDAPSAPSVSTELSSQVSRTQSTARSFAGAGANTSTFTDSCSGASPGIGFRFRARCAQWRQGRMGND
jgi:hypothetical protein